MPALGSLFTEEKDHFIWKIRPAGVLIEFRDGLKETPPCPKTSLGYPYLPVGTQRNNSPHCLPPGMFVSIPATKSFEFRARQKALLVSGTPEGHVQTENKSSSQSLPFNPELQKLKTRSLTLETRDKKLPRGSLARHCRAVL